MLREGILSGGGATCRHTCRVITRAIAGHCTGTGRSAPGDPARGAAPLYPRCRRPCCRGRTSTEKRQPDSDRRQPDRTGWRQSNILNLTRLVHCTDRPTVHRSTRSTASLSGPHRPERDAATSCDLRGDLRTTRAGGAGSGPKPTRSGGHSTGLGNGCDCQIGPNRSRRGPVGMPTP